MNDAEHSHWHVNPSLLLWASSASIRDVSAKIREAVAALAHSRQMLDCSFFGLGGLIVHKFGGCCLTKMLVTRAILIISKMRSKFDPMLKARMMKWIAVGVGKMRLLSEVQPAVCK